MHKTLHLAAKFYHLVYDRKRKVTNVTKIISWDPPQSPFFTLNTNGNSKDNTGKARDEDLKITLVKQEMKAY